MNTSTSFIFVLSFLLVITVPELYFTSSKPTSFSLELIHNDSPKSPFYSGDLTLDERIQKYQKISNSRISYLMSIASNNKTMRPNKMQPHVIGDNFLYLVSVDSGSPSTNVLLVLDTGSDFVWTQCQPCKLCSPQNYPIYDSTKSNTYEKIPCDNPACESFQCTDGEFRYEVHYADQSYTIGSASWETFTFSSRNKQITNIKRVLFGCSNFSLGFSSTNTGNVSGILGMNSGPKSFISQIGSYARSRFSYCFVDQTKEDPPMSYLKFSNDIGYIGGQVKTTSFAKHPNPHIYGLNLLDISFNNKRLNIPPDTFKVKPDGSGGVMIDTGCIVSYMEADAYWKLNEELVNYFIDVKLEQYFTCPPPVHLCWRLPEGFQSFPRMTYHFEGADLELDPEQMFMINPKENILVLAVAPFEGLTALCSWQQHNREFIYDLNRNTLSFVSEKCAEGQV